MIIDSSALVMNPDCWLRTTLTPEVRSDLMKSISTYPQFYDEVFIEVGTRMRTNEFISKVDISALAAWKRLNLNAKWMESLQETRDSDLIQESRSLLARDLPARERIRRFWHSGIPGFSSGTFALASTVLAAWDPLNFGITDRRAREGMTELGCSCGSRINRYSTYLTHLQFIRDEMNSDSPDSTISCRNVDMMLFSRVTS